MRDTRVSLLISMSRTLFSGNSCFVMRDIDGYWFLSMSRTRFWNTPVLCMRDIHVPSLSSMSRTYLRTYFSGNYCFSMRDIDLFWFLSMSRTRFWNTPVFCLRDTRVSLLSSMSWEGLPHIPGRVGRVLGKVVI